MKPVYVIIIVILVTAGAFLGGVEYQKRQTPRLQFSNGQSAAQRGPFQQRIGTQGFRPVSGEITESDNTSVTIKLSDGSSKIIIISNATSINKAEAGSKADLLAGVKIAALGKENSDGSITAQNIQLNPQDRLMFGNQNAPKSQ